jgi:oligopeptide transport system substrate-binding protein
MFHRERLFGLVTLAIVFTMIISGCIKPGTRGPEINLNLETEPPTADPALTTDMPSIQVVELLFLGLTDFEDRTLETIPELATQWTVSADGLVWTFKMRQDVQWVHWNPVEQKLTKKGPVTAHDVVYGVRRSIDPATMSGYAKVNYIIRDAERVNKRESPDIESIGVRAIDDYTVEFTLEQPAGYFPGIAGMWVNRPQPRQAIEEHGDAWTEPGNIWTNGPYLLDTWEHGQKMVMLKNPEYFDAKNVQIARINWQMVVETTAAFGMYERGELDVAAPPLEDIERIKADPQLSQELHIAPELCTYYYGFNVTKPPFDNAQVRRAFSYAIDRQKLIDIVTKGGQLPAKSFACPGIFGSVAEDPSFPGITFDAEQAKALLAEAGYPEGEGLPDITLMFNSSEAHQKIAEFIQMSWREHLNVDVRLAHQEWKVYLDTMNQNPPQIWRLGWCADYPDQNNWVLQAFHPLKGDNHPQWDPSSEPARRFMELTERAAASVDPAERRRLYFEAEKILTVDEALIAPIYYYTRVVCTKPYVNRTYASLGGEHIDKWIIERE